MLAKRKYVIYFPEFDGFFYNGGISVSSLIFADIVDDMMAIVVRQSANEETWKIPADVFFAFT